MDKSMKDKTAAGDVNTDEDTSTPGGPGTFRTIVRPNSKCLGCLHYDNTRGECTVGTYPASCGDGSEPETGYAPLVPSEEAYQEWRAKRGLQHNAPRATVPANGPTSGSGSKKPVGGDESLPLMDFKLQVLGDEGHMELSLRSLLDGEEAALVKSDFAMHHTVEGFMSNLKTMPKEGPHRGKFITAHMNHGPFLQALQKHPQGKTIHGMLTAHLNSPKNAGPKGPMKVTAKSHKPGHDECKKCGYAMKGGACSRCKYKSLRTTLAFDSEKQAKRVGGPVNKGQEWTATARPKKVAATFTRQAKKLTPGKLKPQPKLPAMPRMPHLNKASDPWAIATAAWQKVSPGKKAKYTKQAMARHRRSGENIKAGKYAKRAPREFMERLARKSGPSLVEEFGHSMAGMLFKARHDIWKAAANVIHLPAGPVAQAKPKAPAGASPVLHAVRKRQMDNPSPAAHAKARQAGGGKVFSHGSLAQHAGVKPEAIADLAHGSQHVHDFHNKVRQQFGDKVKHITSGQIRSAYHSTGLMHSMTNKSTGLLASDLDLIKAHKAGKRCCIGHSSKGKPIHNDAHGAETLDHEEHREAGELHDNIASRLSDAAFGYGGMGSSRGKLPPAAHKYLMKMADHHRHIASRHHKTASMHENHGPTAPMPAEPFGKSKKSEGVRLNNSPTDADIAKAMLAGGGAGALGQGGLVLSPLNVEPAEALRHTMQLGLPTEGKVVEVKAAPQPEPEPKYKPMVGGVPSSAWDHTNYRG